MNNPLYSPSIFIGRQNELAIFKQMLDGQSEPAWMLTLYGKGGIGKTQLLRHFVDMAEERRAGGEKILVTREFIDLYWSSFQRETGILKGIADQLGPQYFTRFYQTLDRYQQLLGHEIPDADLITEQRNRARSQFLESYAKLDATRIALIFDTAELAHSSVVRFWQTILPQLKQAHPKTLVLVAGREIALPPSEFNQAIEVSAFSPEEIADYFHQQGLVVASDITERVAELSRGRPILVALTTDWIRFGNEPRELVSYGPEQFESAMVERILQLRFPEDEAILAAAHLHRRFNEEILAFLLDQSTDLTTRVTESLARFSFVKYRPPVEGNVGSCLLHDEMRELVKDKVWPKIDQTGEYRQGWSRKIIGYYREKMAYERNVLERQTLSLERLFYALDTDLKSGFAYSRELFGAARERRDSDLMESINAELGPFNQRLSAGKQRELDLRQAIVLQQRGRYSEAIEKMTALLQDPNCDIFLQASIRAQLTQADVYEGNLQTAIDLGKQWEEWFQSLLGDPSIDKPGHTLIETEFGWVCNNIGLAYRGQSKLNNTIEYYTKALAHFVAVGAYPEIANTKNNLGYVYHRLGQDDQALSECEQALKIRQKLKSSDHLGYSYNVLGMIYVDLMRPEEAEDYFKKALREFEEAGSERGRGLVFIAYARLLRQWGWYKEKFVGGVFDPDCKEYGTADAMLNTAIEIFEQLPDDANLSEALNDKGTLLRQRRYYDEAIGQFEKSSKLARKIGNRYREIDNLVDIAISSNYAGHFDQALENARQASTLALDTDAYYLFAKAQKVVANVLVTRQDYDGAYDAAANALVYIMRLDPQGIKESPPKRELYYNEIVDWVSDLILKLPSRELAQEKTQKLIRRWEQETSDGRSLAASYPGFVTRMTDLARDYAFLSEN
ncbi:MAG: tetratricopeptide repeat protein [Anaerolineae bacterium]